jgi:hypothetical protein
MSDSIAADLAAPVATGLPADTAQIVAGGGTATEADVTAMLAAMAAMQSRLDALEAERAAKNAPVLVSTAESLRNLLAIHASGVSGATADHTRALALADDAVDAAGNAVKSGDVSALRQITDKLSRALRAAHPGPGDHDYFRQALAFAEYHLPLAMDTFTDDQPASAAPAISSDKPPARVLQGSVTG